eukprot:217360_1
MAFNLEDFVVKLPKGLLTQSQSNDTNEPSDIEMNEFEFDDSDSDENDTNNNNSNDDESNTNNSIKINNKNILNLARENTYSPFNTSIQDKITHWKSKYKSRIEKTYLKNTKLKSTDEKWYKNIKKIQETNLKTKPKYKKMSECGDTHSDFSLLGISRIILSGIRNELKWNYPTPVQRETIPLALKGYDLLINAVTGSGKSGAFVIPILERLISSEISELNERRILCITPTRELAIQIYEIFNIFISENIICKKLSLSVCMPIIGGVSCESQYEYLKQHRCDVIIATPGRLIDLYRNYFEINDMSSGLLSNIEILVLDEADKLLDMGFQPELFEIFKYLPEKRYRQNILCSATLTDSVLKLANLSLNNDNMKRVSIDPSLSLNTKNLTQEFIRLHTGQEKYRKAMLLAMLLTTFNQKKCIIFCRTKKETHLMRIICSFFELKCIELHGDLSQYDRLKSLQLFKNNKIFQFLFCTDIASRGIDIANVDLVINLEFPTNIKTYIHRVGRTARAGNYGYSCTFVTDKRKKLLKKIVLVNKKGIIKSRTLNHEFVLWCHNKIVDVKNEIVQLIKSENKEREMRLMHMKLKKGQNLLEHEKEIFERKKKTWIMGQNEKRQVRKAAQRNDLGTEETKRLMNKDKMIKLEKQMKKKEQRTKDLQWSKKLQIGAIGMKKGMKRKFRMENKTKTGKDMVKGFDSTIDMIKNPYKYNKNVKKNIQIKMKKNENKKDKKL